MPHDPVAIIRHYDIKAKSLSGTRMQGWCPFHADEKTASLSYDLKTGKWICYGCGKSGDVLDFVAGMEGFDISKRRWILEAQLRAAKISLEKHVDHATLFEKPKVADKDVSRFQVPDWKALYQHYSRNGTKPSRGTPAYAFHRRIEPVTLMKFDVMWDDFRKNLVFPVKWGGKIVGFQRRVTLKQDEEYLPYINSDAIPKRRIFYWTKNYGIKPDHPPLLVEGVFDVMRAYQHGWTNVLHGFGANLVPTQVAIFQRMCRQGGFICFDNDDPDTHDGQNPGMRAAEKLAGEVGAQVVKVPFVGDLDDTTSGQFWTMMRRAGYVS